jgi:hypothetical protein
MKKDPMVLWAPSMAVTRTVHYSSRDDVNMEPGSSQTQIQIRLTPVEVQVLPDLLMEAEKARTDAGYSEAGRRFGGQIDGRGFWIDCYVMSSASYHSGATPSYSTTDDVLVINLELRWNA